MWTGSLGHRGGGGCGQGSDTVIGRKADKHPTIEAIGLLWVPYLQAGDQKPRVGVFPAGVAFPVLVIEVRFNVAEEVPSGVISAPRGGVV